MPEKEAAHKINNFITAPQVRVVGDNIEQPEVMSLRDALNKADEMGLDLVEISPKADPPVCRIVDYSKFLYQQKKKAKETFSEESKKEMYVPAEAETLIQAEAEAEKDKVEKVDIEREGGHK